MLEISSEISYDILDTYLDPTQTEKLPDDVYFKVVAGKKKYDIIRYYEFLGGVGYTFFLHVRIAEEDHGNCHLFHQTFLQK